jgi:hypothetical protein
VEAADRADLDASYEEAGAFCQLETDQGADDEAVGGPEEEVYGLT